MASVSFIEALLSLLNLDIKCERLSINYQHNKCLLWSKLRDPFRTGVKLGFIVRLNTTRKNSINVDLGNATRTDLGLSVTELPVGVRNVEFGGTTSPFEISLHGL